MECSLAFNQGSYVGTGCPEEQSQFESGESAVRLCTVCGGKTLQLKSTTMIAVTRYTAYKKDLADIKYFADISKMLVAGERLINILSLLIISGC
jgi:hypothetical protein